MGENEGLEFEAVRDEITADLGPNCTVLVWNLKHELFCWCRELAKRNLPMGRLFKAFAHGTCACEAYKPYNAGYFCALGKAYKAMRRKFEDASLVAHDAADDAIMAGR